MTDKLHYGAYLEIKTKKETVPSFQKECIACGTHFSDSVSYCSGCGEKLTELSSREEYPTCIVGGLLSWDFGEDELAECWSYASFGGDTIHAASNHGHGYWDISKGFPTPNEMKEMTDEFSDHHAKIISGILNASSVLSASVRCGVIPDEEI